MIGLYCDMYLETRFCGTAPQNSDTMPPSSTLSDISATDLITADQTGPVPPDNDINPEMLLQYESAILRRALIVGKLPQQKVKKDLAYFFA